MCYRKCWRNPPWTDDTILEKLKMNAWVYIASIFSSYTFTFCVCRFEDFNGASRMNQDNKQSFLFVVKRASVFLYRARHLTLFIHQPPRESAEEFELIVAVYEQKHVRSNRESVWYRFGPIQSFVCRLGQPVWFRKASLRLKTTIALGNSNGKYCSGGVNGHKRSNRADQR